MSMQGELGKVINSLSEEEKGIILSDILLIINRENDEKDHILSDLLKVIEEKVYRNNISENV